MTASPAALLLSFALFSCRHVCPLPPTNQTAMLPEKSLYLHWKGIALTNRLPLWATTSPENGIAGIWHSAAIDNVAPLTITFPFTFSFHCSIADNHTAEGASLASCVMLHPRWHNCPADLFEILIDQVRSSVWPRPSSLLFYHGWGDRSRLISLSGSGGGWFICCLFV